MTDPSSIFPAEPVHFQVDALPSDVAQKIREVQSENPELLRSIILYGITHRAVFETLSRSWSS